MYVLDLIYENFNLSLLQDTIIGLQALAKYAEVVFGKSTDLDVTITGLGISETISVDQTNSLVLHQKPVQVPNSLVIKTKGTGCVFIQVSQLICAFCGSQFN